MKLNKFKFILYLFILGSCGFKPMLKNINLSELNISEINYKGPSDLIFFTQSNLPIKINQTGTTKKIINISITKSLEDKTKNSSGITTEENMRINIMFEVIEKNKKTILKDQVEDYKVIGVTSNPSLDDDIRKKEQENMMLNLIRKMSFIIQARLTNQQ